MNKFFQICAFLAIVAPAAAHEMQKGPNGGTLIEVSGHHVEFVSDASEIALFLTDAKDRPVASAGTKAARAIVQEDGKTAIFVLEPGAPNKLMARLSRPLGQGARIVISATLADGHSIQARFVKD